MQKRRPKRLKKGLFLSKIHWEVGSGEMRTVGSIDALRSILFSNSLLLSQWQILRKWHFFDFHFAAIGAAAVACGYSSAVAMELKPQ